MRDAHATRCKALSGKVGEVHGEKNCRGDSDCRSGVDVIVGIWAIHRIDEALITIPLYTPVGEGCTKCAGDLPY